ncbi:hypothetical protein BCR35DRAFT_310536 [Leucosporidium creatinivorum]|uniref:F-box domain-containing protein n=1 Tax=Leucosporidium creatinivorum TaxID=106004 RepID=A0A1Y2D2Q9_9BASI|nr:hypothetical protein BCR35DRAFT_310536 [Leucosporidium creatinivorum]
MASIQDLPPELLRRIIELFDRNDWTMSYKSLCKAALVARAWRGPAQDVLVCTVPFDGFDAASDGRTPRPSISSRTLDCADLDFDPAQKVLELLTEAGATVRSLDIMHTDGNDLDLGIMSFEMLAGLHSLNIGGHFEGQPPIPSAATIELRTLFLDPEYLPTPAFLELLVGAAPFLTRLEVYMDPEEEEFPGSYTTALQMLALQLRHLKIAADATSTPTRPRTVDLHGFVASCTSLRSLELHCATPASIMATLTAVRSPLVLLATELDDEWSRVADAKRVAELVDDARTQWEDACRARGVEPRDEQRFFTDYPAE